MKNGFSHTACRLPTRLLDRIDAALDAERARHPGRAISRNSLIVETLVAAFDRPPHPPLAKDQPHV